MKISLKADGKTVLFLSDSATLNANDEMWQMLDVACETPLIDGRESLWVVFQNVAEPTLLSSESMLERCEDGHYRILFPNGVIAVPGEWTFQLFTRTYDTVNENWANRIASDLCGFTVSNGLPISGEGKVTKSTIASLYAEALQKIQAETENAEDISELQSDISSIDNALSNISFSISSIDNALSEVRTDVTVLQGAVSQLSSNVGGVQYTVSVLETDVNKNLGHRIQMSLSNDYVLSLSLLAKDGTVLGETQTVDFPVESMVVNGAYDDTNKKIVLTLQNGNTVDIPVGDLVDGLISSTEKGQPNGVASLGEDGKVPLSQLPDDIGGGEEITQETFNDMLVEGLTANGNTLTDEEKASACDWMGALKKETAVTNNHQAYAKTAGGVNTMWNMDNGPTPSTICVRDANGRLRIAEPLAGGDCVNLTYFNANNGTKWYKHVMSQVVEVIGTFDLLIVSTRATNYTSGQEIIDDWKDGKISSFFNSSADTTMKIKITGISVANPFCIKTTDTGVVYGLGYQLDIGTLSYRETIQKL